MHELAVRTARNVADIKAVRALLRDYAAALASNTAAGENFRIPGFEAELTFLPGAYVTPGGLLLATVDDEPAGCIALRLMPPAYLKNLGDPSPSLSLEIKRLWVGSRHRGLGLGRKLATEAFDLARANGATALYLDTLPAAMPEAHALYLDLGFESIPPYSDHPPEGLACFRKLLHAPLKTAWGDCHPE